MDKVIKLGLSFVGIVLLFLSLMIGGLAGLLIFSLNLILYSIYRMLDENITIEILTNLLILAATLSLIPYFVAMVSKANLVYLTYASIYITISSIILLYVYYIYRILKRIFSSIEVRLRK